MDKIWRTYKVWAGVQYQHLPLNYCRSLPEQDDCKPFRLAFLPISQPIHFRRNGRMFLFRSVLIEIPGNI